MVEQRSSSSLLSPFSLFTLDPSGAAIERDPRGGTNPILKERAASDLPAKPGRRKKRHPIWL